MLFKRNRGEEKERNKFLRKFLSGDRPSLLLLPLFCQNVTSLDMRVTDRKTFSQVVECLLRQHTHTDVYCPDMANGYLLVLLYSESANEWTRLLLF